MLIFLENLAGGTLIRVGSLIRHCIVYITQSRDKNKNIGCGVGSSACQKGSIYGSHGSIHIHPPIIR